jgi:hypothetical protein
MSLTTDAKVALLKYCRLHRQMHWVATEVSVSEGCIADVLASDGKYLIDYEVKISMSDLRADRLKPKHKVYDPTPIVWVDSLGGKGGYMFTIEQKGKYRPYILDGENKRNLGHWGGYDTFEEAQEAVEGMFGYARNSPNMLYYVVPFEMWKANEGKILEALHDSYGVMTFSGDNAHSLGVMKKAKKLHKNKVSQTVLRRLTARMSSELAALSDAYYSSVKKFTELGKSLQQPELNLGDLTDDTEN